MSDQLELFPKSMEELVREAVAAGRIPIECMEEIEISDELVAKTVIFHEA